MPGVEPGTSSLSGTRSNQLSYTPFFAPPCGASKGKPSMAGLACHAKLATSPLQARNCIASEAWWRQPGLNRRPRACKARALPTELCPQHSRCTLRTSESHRCRGTHSISLKTYDNLSDQKRCDLPRLRLSPGFPEDAPIRYDHRVIVLSSSEIPNLRSEIPERILLRKEVIQPQVPLRLPCYDFIPIINHTFGIFLPCGLYR